MADGNVRPTIQEDGPLKRTLRLVVAGAMLVATAGAAGAGEREPSATAPTSQPDMRQKTPAEELAHIAVQEGYHLELVAADPDLISPVLCTWDGDGRMYVAEMRTYMLDINGKKAHTPASRVSRWEDQDGDGKYETHTVFADKLMLPRMVLPLDDRVLIRETDTKDIYSYRDTRGDGVSNEKVKVYTGGTQEGNLEHQPSGLIWDVDNWIYVTNQGERFRFTHGVMEKDKIGYGGGQWGMAMDDTGRLIFATAGSERPAHNFQVMPKYGDINLPNELEKGFTSVWPIALLADFEGGPKRVRPGGGLNVFTACCGGSVFRGDALPADLEGDYILPEPVGRLIRRAKISEQNGRTFIANAYHESEFIRSTDPNFRPVYTTTGPDGCLYVCDMYHGIIQEANWTREGSYLRPKIKEYGLDKNIDRGRIWRVVHDGYTPRKTKPRMLEESTAELVQHLTDANGWWRDTAQKLIVLRGDKSVVPALEEMARGHSNPLARLHALWTLEGLDGVDTALLLAKLKDEDPRVRAAAVRIGEPLLKKEDPEVVAALRGMVNEPDGTVAKQLCMSMVASGYPDGDTVANMVIRARDARNAKDDPIKEIVKKYRENETKKRAEEARRKELQRTDPLLAMAMVRGKELYGQTCIACHGGNGMGAPAPDRKGETLAPPLRGSARLLGSKALAARLVLHGMTGVNNGKTYPGQMPSFAFADDDWLATILTYVRNEWGNKAPTVYPEEVARARRASAGRTGPFKTDELMAPPLAATVNPVVVTLEAAGAAVSGNGVDVVRAGGRAEVAFPGGGSDEAKWRAWIAERGTYSVVIRVAAPDGPARVSVDVGGWKTAGPVMRTAAWGERIDVPLGIVHVDAPGEVVVRVRAAEGKAVNVASVRLEKRG